MCLQPVNQPTVTRYVHLLCLQPVNQPTVTRCVHLFCLGCILKTVEFSKLQQQQYHDRSDTTPCPCCRRPFKVCDLLRVLPEQKIKEIQSMDTQSKKKYTAVAIDSPPLWSPVATLDQLKQLSPRNEASHHFGYSSKFPSLTPALLNHFRQACGMPPGCRQHEKLPPGALRASPKMAVLLQILFQGQADARARGEEFAGKVVVFSQHRAAVLHCATVLKENGVHCVSIVPGDTQTNQSRAIETFHQDPSCQVFVLHAGR